MNRFALDAAVIGETVDMFHQLYPVITVSGDLRSGKSRFGAGHIFAQDISGIAHPFRCKNFGHEHLMVQPRRQVVLSVHLLELNGDHFIPGFEITLPPPVQGIQRAVLCLEFVPEIFQAVRRIADRTAQIGLVRDLMVENAVIAETLRSDLFTEDVFDLLPVRRIGKTRIPDRIAWDVVPVFETGFVIHVPGTDHDMAHIRIADRFQPSHLFTVLYEVGDPHGEAHFGCMLDKRRTLQPGKGIKLCDILAFGRR